MAVRLAVFIMTILLSCWVPGIQAYAGTTPAPAESTSTNSAVNPAEDFQISPGTNTIAVANAQPHTSSVQDLSIFGVISLGIMGLIWVRRHTTEL